jgi:outer membrane receptor protein involved in Fe transport
VDQSRIVGREDHATLSLGQDACVIDYAHVFTGAYDRSSDINYNGETLVLTPRHTHDASIALAYARTGLRARGRWVSLRYIRRQNNPEKALRPYRVFDVSARYRVHRTSPDVTVAFGVDNLTNEYYELLERYPSPGRTWHATTTVSF